MLRRKNETTRFALAFACCFLFGAATLVQAADWAQWRGPNRDGKSTETGLLKSWPEGGPEMLWSVEGMGKGYSTVSVSGDDVFTTGQLDEVDYLFKLTKDGELVWKKEIGPGWTENFISARCTPTIVDDVVYVMSSRGVVACFNRQTGSLVWKFDAVGEFNGKIPRWGISESLLVTSDKVICTPGGPDASVVALNRKTGAPVWQSRGLGESSAYCSPFLVQLAERDLIIDMTETKVVGIDEVTGEVLWTHEHTNRWAVHPNTPIVDGNRIYITSGYGQGGQMLEMSDDGSSVTHRWSEESLDVHHGGAILLDGYIYGSNSKGGKWICLDLKTGEVMYEDRGNGKGSLTYADGMLYGYEEKRGQVALVKAQPSGFELVSSFAITKGEDQHWAHPVVANGRLFIRHGDVLMCFDIAAK